jgi:hypothetical protein
MMRNLGGAVGIAVCSVILNDRTNLHFLRIASNLTPANGAMTKLIEGMALRYGLASGEALGEAQAQLAGRYGPAVPTPVWSGLRSRVLLDELQQLHAIGRAAGSCWKRAVRLRVGYAARSSGTSSISWANRMTLSPLSKSTVKSSRPRFSRRETRVPGVARRTIPAGDTMVDVDRQRVPGTSDMAILLPHSGLQRAQIEAGSFERSAQAHVALVHHVDNRRDQLGVRA